MPAQGKTSLLAKGLSLRVAGQDVTGEGMGFGGDFPGVILLPEVRPNTTILVPVPSPPVEFGSRLPQPVGIPFSGEYWMFRPPFSRPPRSAVVRRGNPAALSFHTTDGWPLVMEAHQKLDPPVAIRCSLPIEVFSPSST